MILWSCSLMFLCIFFREMQFFQELQQPPVQDLRWPAQVRTSSIPLLFRSDPWTISASLASVNTSESMECKDKVMQKEPVLQVITL